MRPPTHTSYQATECSLDIDHSTTDFYFSHCYQIAGTSGKRKQNLGGIWKLMWKNLFAVRQSSRVSACIPEALLLKDPTA